MHRGRHAGPQLRQEHLNAINDGNDVCARLTLDVDDDRGLAIHPGCLLGVLGCIDDVGHIRGADGGAVTIGDDDGLVIGTGNQLVVGANGVRLAIAVERSLRLVHVCCRQCGAQVFKAQVVGRQLGGVGLDAHGGLLSAGNGNQSDTGDLRYFLRQVGIRCVLDLVERQ